MSVLRLTKGAVFAGDYEIVGPLAEGGMGSVYVARQISTGKERALKILQSQFVSDPRTRERFTREARAGSQVDSEHVVEVVGAGIDAETNTPWLAMELLRGEDLESYATRNGPLSPPQVLEIFRQLCHGLAAAHASGLVHRDLKPENVFLATARRVGVPFTVKILDFGIAKVVMETKHDVTDAVGTPTWMAPEQTESGKSITPATDVWALGLIAFRLLAGKPYWKAANEEAAKPMAILREVVFEPMEPASVRAKILASLAHLPLGFDGWFARAVSRDPEKRFRNASAALAALEGAFGAAGVDPSGLDLPPTDPPPTVPGEPWKAPGAAPGTAVTQAGPFAGPVKSGERRLSVPPSEDVDQYERRLSGGRVGAWLALVAVLAGAGGAAWHFRGRAAASPFDGRETEPNNRAPEANPLPYGETVRAQIGQRLDNERSDRDFFRTAVPKTAKVTRVSLRSLPNIAPCVLVYRVGIDEPFQRFCAGQPARDILVPALRLDAGDYFFTVLQDRERYGEEPAPPVLENVSDGYELTVGPGETALDAEVEPNDHAESASALKPGHTLRGRLAWMRDVDVICADSDRGAVRFVVEDEGPRPRGAVLEVTPIGGPADGISTRVHAPQAMGTVSEHDVRSPLGGPLVPESPDRRCISVALAPDTWAEPPLPHLAPASEHEWVVRLQVP